MITLEVRFQSPAKLVFGMTLQLRERKEVTKNAKARLKIMKRKINPANIMILITVIVLGNLKRNDQSILVARRRRKNLVARNLKDPDQEAKARILRGVTSHVRSLMMIITKRRIIIDLKEASIREIDLDVTHAVEVLETKEVIEIEVGVHEIREIIEIEVAVLEIEEIIEIGVEVRKVGIPAEGRETMENGTIQ